MTEIAIWPCFNWHVWNGKKVTITLKYNTSIKFLSTTLQKNFIPVWWVLFPDALLFLWSPALYFQLVLHSRLFLLSLSPSGPFRDCFEAQEAGHSTSGMYLIRPDEAERPIQVWCEQDIDGGGWTVIHSRRDGSVNFFRNWDNYKVMTLAPPPFTPSALLFLRLTIFGSSRGQQ